MTIRFNYAESAGGDILKFFTLKGTEIEVLFQKEEPVELYVDGNDFDIKDKALNGLFVNLRGGFVSLRAVVDQAEAAYPSFMNDEDGIEQSKMARELSSPSMTGRI